MIAALSAWHRGCTHEPAARRLRAVVALPAHVMLEAYSVLTRLPGGLAVPAPIAADTLARRFGGQQFTLPSAARRSVLATLAAAGVHGGASDDGLVALEAARHDESLSLTLDRRAQETYRRLGTRFELVRGRTDARRRPNPATAGSRARRRPDARAVPVERDRLGLVLDRVRRWQAGVRASSERKRRRRRDVSVAEASPEAPSDRVEAWAARGAECRTETAPRSRAASAAARVRHRPSRATRRPSPPRSAPAR